ncbi:MAG: hypothetical protein RXO36_05500 [Candidatus Nanopusillus acidilobi]
MKNIFIFLILSIFVLSLFSIQSHASTNNTYTLTFTETGLPQGTVWYVSLDGITLYSYTNTITFHVPIGTYEYTIPQVPTYYSNPSSGVIVLEQNYTQNVVFYQDPKIGGYGIDFEEKGLPMGTQWGVSLYMPVNYTYKWVTQYSTTYLVAFTVPNQGNYPYKVLNVSGYNVNPQSGVASLSGYQSAIIINVQFTPNASYQYYVNFTESGLPSGYSWSVTFNNTQLSSSSDTISFKVPNGQYSYSVTVPSGYIATPSSGIVIVNSSNQNINIVISQKTNSTVAKYTLTFWEQGLPSGTKWSVTLNALTQFSTTQYISFIVQNGTYNYTINQVQGYTSNISQNSIKIQGKNANVYVWFNKVPSGLYQINFIEVGLPLGTSWSVCLKSTEYPINITYSSTSYYITFIQLNGTYNFTVNPVKGYKILNPSGAIVVNGHNVNQSIEFIPLNNAVYGITFIESGLSQGTIWAISLNGTYLASSTNKIIFYMQNGTYPYHIYYPSGYSIQSINPNSSVIIVNGKDVQISITFNGSSNASGGGISGGGGLGSLGNYTINDIYSLIKQHETLVILGLVGLFVLLLASRRPE